MTASIRSAALALGMCCAYTPVLAAAQEPAAEEALRAQEAASPAPPASAQDGEASLDFRAFIGFGVGTRTLHWSEDGEQHDVATGAFPALDLGMSFHMSVSELVSIGPELHYQTSIAHRIDEPHIAGAADSLRIRASRVDAVLAAVFSPGTSGLRIVPALGYSLHALTPEVHHLLTPSYALSGPVLRLSVRIPLGASVALRLAPEGQWLRVSDELEQRGLTGSGFAIGGEVALELALNHAFGLELSGRIWRAYLPQLTAESANDTAQFATARVVWTP